MNENYCFGLELLARYGVQTIPHSGGAGFSLCGVFVPLHSEETKEPLLKLAGWSEYDNQIPYAETYMHNFWIDDET